MNITNWNLVPANSVNGIEFGTERSAVKKILGKPKRVFRKTPDAVNTTDAYADFHVYYSVDDRMEAIEFFGDNTILNVNSQPVFPGRLSEAKELFPDLEGEYGSYISKASSIGLCVEDDSIVSILAGCKGYYL